MGRFDRAMIWILLAAIGIPLWFCATAIVVLFVRNRHLRRRPGNIPVRRQKPGKKSWQRGHGVWTHDVFGFRGSPAAWAESLLWVGHVATRAPTPHERSKLRRLGDGAVIAAMRADDSTITEFATSAEHAVSLLGPHVTAAVISRPFSGQR